MYDANIMKKSSRFYLKYNPDNRWSFWTGKWWSLCSEISGQFTPKLGGQFDRLFQIIANSCLIWLNRIKSSTKVFEDTLVLVTIKFA